MKYIISYDTEFGCVSAESNDPGDLFFAYSELQSVAGRLSEKFHERRKKNPLTRQSQKSSRSNARVPETTTILRELESSFLNTNFFSEARTTGETRERLHDLTGRYFASRKVSQALGILRDRGKLRRKGRRNYYRYSLS